MAYRERIHWWLSCDGGCQRIRTGSGPPDDRKSQSVGAHLEAKNDGWHHQKGRDLCAECWEAGKR